VTRLGKFSPYGQFFTITEVALGLFFSTVMY
jgi:hypothetical protein